MPLQFSFNQPIESIDTTGIHIEMQVDTLWEAVEPLRLLADSLAPLLGRRIPVEWTPGAKYRLSIDSAAIVGIYGEHNPPVKRDFTVKALEEYANLYFNVSGADSTAIVELLNGSDAPVMSAPVINGRATFRFVNPGTYYARLYFDSNGDGKWTTGMMDSIQPEEVAYYPGKLDLKRNWDVEQDWDIYATPLDQQKPRAILKNKPKTKRGEEQPTEDEEEEDPLLGNPNDPVNRRRNNNLNNPGTVTGGFQQLRI